MDIEAIKAALLFGSSGGGSGGTSNYNQLSNKPKINGVELSGDKSGTDLGLCTIITADDNTTINGYQVPQLTTAQVQSAYNAVISGKVCVIVDKNGWMHLSVIQADAVGDEVTISVAYYTHMILTYADDGSIDYVPLELPEHNKIAQYFLVCNSLLGLGEDFFIDSSGNTLSTNAVAEDMSDKLTLGGPQLVINAVVRVDGVDTLLAKLPYTALDIEESSYIFGTLAGTVSIYAKVAVDQLSVHMDDVVVE